MTTLANRIKSERLKRGMTQDQLAEKAGVSQTLIQKLENKKALESRKMSQLAAALGVNTDWLATGEGEKFPAGRRKSVESNAEWSGGFEEWDSSTPLRNDEVALPFFREVELAAGSGRCEIQENHGAKLRFAKSTLKRQGVSVENAYCVTVSGNSMEPVLRHGTTVGIDTGYTRIVDGKMYAIDQDGHLRVKRLYRLTNGGMRINSYNKDEWPDEVLSKEEAESVRVIGIVFWWSVLEQVK